MRAVTWQGFEDVRVEEVPDPRIQEPTDALVEISSTAICGSDLHARHHCDELADVMAETGYEDFMRSEQAVVLGHEFVGQVAEHGPGCRKTVPAGSPVAQ